MKTKEYKTGKVLRLHKVKPEDFYRFLFESIHDGIYQSTRDGRILTANPALVKMLGYGSEEELKKLNIARDIYFLPSDRDSFLRRMEKEGKFEDVELVLKKKDGSRIIVLENSYPVYDRNGEFLYYEGTLIDITDRKKAEDELKQERALLRKLIDNLPDLINIKDSSGHYIINNIPHMKSVGVESQEEIKGKTPFDFFPHNEAEIYVRDDLSVIQSGIPIKNKEECSVQKDTQATHWYLTNKIPLMDENGNVTKIITVSHDITERKKTELVLIQAKEKAEESNRLKTAFLHNISHEIRTPMNAIVGFANLLESPDLSEATRQEYIKIINQSSKQLLEIISDIVEISNIETGLVKISTAEVDLKSVLTDLSKQYRPLSESSRITFKVEIPQEYETISVVTDITKLIQIISNLLNNAFKFTPPGGVIELGLIKDYNNLRFYVRDTGPGIEHKYHQKIFERFYQIDRPGENKSEGTGLGLAICKAYTELLGGTIGLKSEPGKGSEFFFTIPSSRPDNNPENKISEIAI